MCVYAPQTPVLVEARRGCQGFWNLSYRLCEPLCGPGNQERAAILLMSEPSLWPSLRLLIFKKQLEYRPKHSISLNKTIILTKLPFLHSRKGLSQHRNDYSLKGETSFSLLFKCQQKEGSLGSYCSSQSINPHTQTCSPQVKTWGNGLGWPKKAPVQKGFMV